MSLIEVTRKYFKFDKESPWYFYRKVTWWSLIISACITLPFIIFEFFMTGSAVFLYYGDYNAQQICFYEHSVAMVHSGDFGWDWLTDLGSNFTGSYSYYLLGSPFFWLMCAFPSSWAPYLMAPIYMVKYIVAAILAYAYLQRFVKNKNYAVIGALLYSFSGFQIYNTFFNQFHDVVAFFPLLLIGMEELVQHDRRGIFALSVTINALINYFMFAGQVIFCVVYFIARLSSRSFRITWKKFFMLVLEAVLGFLMSMFLFLPGALALMGNSRISSSIVSFPDKLDNPTATQLEQYNKSFNTAVKKLFVYLKSGEVYWQRYGQIIQSYFFPPDIPSRVNFFYGHETRWTSLSMYLPMFSMSGVFALFTVKGRSWLKGICIYLTAASLLPVLNSSFFLFNSSYYARWLYMMILMFALATTVSLEDAKTDWKTPTWLMTVFSIAIAAIVGFGWYKKLDSDFDFTGDYKLGNMAYLGRYIISVVLCFLGIWLTAHIIKKYRFTKQFENAVLYGVAGMTVVYACVHITTGKIHSSKSEFLVDRVIEGEVILPDPEEEFYRIDFYRASISPPLDNLGIYWEYPSIECFHTVVPPSIMDFYPKIGVTRSVGSRAESKYYGLRAFTSTRYSFVDSAKNKLKKVETQVTDEETGVTSTVITYEGNHDMPGFVYVDTQNGFDIYENENCLPMGFAYNEFMTESEFKKITTSKRHLYLCKYLVVPDELAEYYSQFMTEVKSSEKADATLTMFEKSVDERLLTSCTDFNYTSYGFDADITLDKANIVFFSVPYEDNGWTVTVNGIEKEVLRLTYGFVGVECEAGENDIEFSYTTPGFRVGGTVTVMEKEFTLPGGLWISLAALAAYIVYLAIGYIKKHKADVSFFSFDYYDDCDCVVIPSISAPLNVESEITSETIADEPDNSDDDTK